MKIQPQPIKIYGKMKLKGKFAALSDYRRRDRKRGLLQHYLQQS